MSVVVRRTLHIQHIAVLAIVLAVFAPDSFRAFAQSGAIANDDRQSLLGPTHDYNVDGQVYRVPIAYMPPTFNKDDEYLRFSFWISDGMPVGFHRKPNASMEGRGRFWPPDDGKPNVSSEDFAVRVAKATHRADGLEAVRRDRFGGSFDSFPRIERYGSLTCGIFPLDRAVCRNPLDEDPLVSITGGRNPMFPGNYLDLFMYFYSGADRLEIGPLYFPDLGLPRWTEVVCRTLSLIRQWRLSNGPAPTDCVRAPSLSLLQK